MDDAYIKRLEKRIEQLEERQEELEIELRRLRDRLDSRNSFEEGGDEDAFEESGADYLEMLNDYDY